MLFPKSVQGANRAVWTRHAFAHNASHVRLKTRYPEVIAIRHYAFWETPRDSGQVIAYAISSDAGRYACVFHIWLDLENLAGFQGYAICDMRQDCDVVIR